MGRVAPHDTRVYGEAMERRYALLDDNDRRVAHRLAALRSQLPPLVQDRICAAMVIGSVARGTAHDRSDIDLVLVLRTDTPRRSDYEWWDQRVAPVLQLEGGHDFLVSPLFVARSATATTEPHLSQALQTGIRVWDPEGIFDDQPEPRA